MPKQVICKIENFSMKINLKVSYFFKWRTLRLHGEFQQNYSVCKIIIWYVILWRTRHFKNMYTSILCSIQGDTGSVGPPGQKVSFILMFVYLHTFYYLLAHSIMVDSD